MVHPIYTEKTECQDCYKCVRYCPVKAIKIENGHADIKQDLCILCGKCVSICPASAQRIRNDIPRAQQLLKMKKTFVSLAPSFPSEFGSEKGKLIGLLMALGFAGVSETALGAEIITNAQSVAGAGEARSTVSSACPVVVELIKKYYPEKVENISPYISPMLAHGLLLKQTYGEDIGIVFIGPCIAKKIEADDNPDIINVALTFNELKKWVKDLNYDDINVSGKNSLEFVPTQADVGVLYPLDGGEESFKKGHDFVSITGVTKIQDAIKEVSDIDGFFEMLACSGGCINGSAMKKDGALISRRREVINYYKDNRQGKKVDSINKKIEHNKLLRDYDKFDVKINSYSDSKIKQTLALLNKTEEKDMLNCGGCGYNSCKDFATAFLDGMAELQMCVTHMRIKAQKKANALIKTIPLGIVIVNENSRILECNTRFIDQFLGSEHVHNEKALASAVGSELKGFVNVQSKVETVLLEGTAKEDIIQHDKRIIKVQLFPIEKGRLTGIIFQDITEPAMKRDTVIKKADEVIQKNLRSVQQIASLLGENAAETEILLNSLIEAFKNPQDDSYESRN